MARRAFSGESTRQLPRGKIEPYRLWFEYLKLALADPEVTVDLTLYKRWGNVAGTDFDDWWEGHWRDLFAPRSTAVVSTVDEFKEATKDPRFVVLRVPIDDTKLRRTKGVDEAIKRARADRKKPDANMDNHAFSITAKRSMNLRTLRGMRKLYELFLENDHDLEAAAIAYYHWSREWNRTVRDKGWNRSLVFVPPFLGSLVEQIEHRSTGGRAGIAASGRKSNASQGKEEQGYDELRRQARRYVRRAQNIAKNVGQGIFPGEF